MRGEMLIFLLTTTVAVALKIATFNCLAPVHKSHGERRESEVETAWYPRATKVLEMVNSLNTGGVSVLCLQEFWFDPRWVELFRDGTSLELVTARRRGVHPHDGSPRSDGVATLYDSRVFAKAETRTIDLSGGRVALCVALTDHQRRRIVVGNLHLPFPCSEKALNEQVVHAHAVADAVEMMGPDFSMIAGDFNCRSNQAAALALETRGFTNCARAYAAASLGLSGIGGNIDYGPTHRTHLGDDIQCDHVFARDYPSSSKSVFGYFDAASLKLTDVSRVVAGTIDASVDFPASFNVSDHLPVTAEFVDAGLDVSPSSVSDECLADDDLDWDCGAPDRDAIR